ncbi:GNAT family N-acetyltransferase [Ureibacillus manganicus]|uniref:Acetyltransferase n=1 Tax=Ureibacillus manganicus DSM 26584 TaxID=1384049 RepID=A0A0A3HTG0_9BACL|nr:GNAT family N-acetyltransferase [Ureibacillus manganicus]KGR73578.1 acetyltransferase [Ureibacillus manganicus DSM 26584]
MNIQLKEVTEDNFYDVVNLKSDEIQEKYIQIYERWVGSNAFFLGMSHAFGLTAKAIYDGEELIGFTTHGLMKTTGRYELVSMMIGHNYQGKGYGIPVINAIIEDMINTHQCKSIYLSVIHDNERAIRLYEKVGFEPTGEVEEGHHPEPIYCLTIA